MLMHASDHELLYIIALSLLYRIIYLIFVNYLLAISEPLYSLFATLVAKQSV